MLRKLVHGNKKSKCKEIEKQQNRAGIKQFMARRGRDWPSRQPLNNHTDLHHQLKQRQQDQPLEKRHNKDQIVDENKEPRSSINLPLHCRKLVNCSESDHADAKRQEHNLCAYHTVRRNTKLSLRSHKHMDDFELSIRNDSHQNTALNDHNIVRRDKDTCLYAHTNLNNPQCVESKEKQVQKSNIRKRNCFLELNETNTIQNNEQRYYRQTELKTEHCVTTNILYPNADEFLDDNSCPQWVIKESILSNPQLDTTNVRKNNLYPNLDEFKIVEDDCC